MPHDPRAPYRAGDMPLLTHAETGAVSTARAGATVAERPSPHTPAGAGDDGSTGGSRSVGGGRSARWRRIRRALYVLLGVAVIGPVLTFVLGWVLFDVPSAADTAVTQVATYTFADGSPLATVRPGNVNRTVVTLDRVPAHVQWAVLAAEDRTFFSNPGFDVTGIARAAWSQLTGGGGGGSTITQQYVKVTTGQDELSLWRKYREIMLAVKISREQTKEQILENYLNVIYLGRGAYGIQAASQAYFGKDVEALSLSEGAMLAGIIQSPSRWDPARDEERSAQRWNFVLDGMVSESWLTPASRASQQFPEWLPEAPTGGGIPGDSAGHLYTRATAELEARGITRQQIDTEGLTITTTIDPGRQQQAVAAVTEMMEGQPVNLRTALVAIDPRTGAIQSYYGGENGVGTDYAQALRQPGSSFKPFVLAAALQGPGGIGLGTTYDGSSPQEFNGGISVRNSEGFDCGECSVETAMTRSINTIFYRMALDVGPAAVIGAAHQAGIPANLLPDPRGGIALGDQEVHPVDMASAFATLAADGVYREPFLVSRVVAADGRVLIDRTESPGVQAIPQQVARNVTESMLDVVTFARLNLSGGRPVAGKTGTVQHPTIESENKDAWMVGYTPSLSTAVWVGSDESDPIVDDNGASVFGRSLPGSIWQDYMDDALEGTAREQFSRFVPLGESPSRAPSGSSGSSSRPASPEGSDSADSGDESSGNGGRDSGNGGFGGLRTPGDEDRGDSDRSGSGSVPDGLDITRPDTRPDLPDAVPPSVRDLFGSGAEPPGRSDR